MTTKDGKTLEELTEILRLAGQLPSGKAISVQYRANPAFNSQIRHLELTYSPDAPKDAPRYLLCKSNLPVEWARNCGVKEAAFYQLIATLPDHPGIIVPCYAARIDPETRDSCIVLADLSATHHAPQTRDQQIASGGNIPSPADMSLVIEVLGQLHAYWWQHPLLGGSATPVAHWFADADRYSDYIERRTQAWETLRRDEADWLPEEFVRFYDRLIGQMPLLWTHYWSPRISGHQHLTLTHGDSYFANFLCPNEGIDAPAYLIDWQSPEAFIGASDLVTLIATFWTPEQRNEDRREEQMLEHYHHSLQENGVTDYAWDDLLQDYRLALLDWLLVPLQDRADGSSKEYWWPKMQHLYAACVDHQCAELLEGESLAEKR